MVDHLVRFKKLMSHLCSGDHCIEVRLHLQAAFYPILHIVIMLRVCLDWQDHFRGFTEQKDGTGVSSGRAVLAHTITLIEAFTSTD